MLTLDGEDLRATNRLMVVIYFQKEIILTELCEFMQISKTTGSLEIDRLVEKRYVKRIQKESDRRNTYLSLTTAGKKQAEKVINSKIKCIGETLNIKSEEELKELLKALKTIENIL